MYKKCFSLRYTHPPFPTDFKNVLSVREAEEIAELTSKNEVSIGRVTGPFTLGPYHPKGEENFDLSITFLPQKGPLIEWFHRPKGLRGIIFCNWWRHGVYRHTEERCHTSPTRTPTSPCPVWLFQPVGVQIQGEYYMDRCLPMDRKMSWSIYETFRTFAEWTTKWLRIATTFSWIICGGGEGAGAPC